MMTINMASSGLCKMLYLPTFILTTDGTISSVMRDAWCQSVWYQTYSFLYKDRNRMRNLHLHIQKEFGKEFAIVLQKWDNLVGNIADFGNHRILTLRYLGVGGTPVSVSSITQNI